MRIPSVDTAPLLPVSSTLSPGRLDCTLLDRGESPQQANCKLAGDPTRYSPRTPAPPPPVNTGPLKKRKSESDYSLPRTPQYRFNEFEVSIQRGLLSGNILPTNSLTSPSIAAAPHVRTRIEHIRPHPGLRI